MQNYVISIINLETFIKKNRHTHQTPYAYAIYYKPINLTRFDANRSKT